MQAHVTVKLKTPFCWQHKPNLRAIRALAERGAIKTSDAANCLNVYRAITEYISDFGQNATLEAGHTLVYHLARLSCMSERLVSHCLRLLDENGIIIYRQRRDERARFKGVYLELINTDEAAKKNDTSVLSNEIPLPSYISCNMTSINGNTSDLVPCAENVHADKNAIASAVSDDKQEIIGTESHLLPCAENPRAAFPREGNCTVNIEYKSQNIEYKSQRIEKKDSKYHCADAQNDKKVTNVHKLPKCRSKAPDWYRRPILDAWTDAHRDNSGNNVLTQSDYKVLNVAVERLFAEDIPLDDVLETIHDLAELIRSGEQWAKMATGNALPGLISRHRLNALKPKNNGHNNVSENNVAILKKYLQGRRDSGDINCQGSGNSSALALSRDVSKH